MMFAQFSLSRAPGSGDKWPLQCSGEAAQWDDGSADLPRKLSCGICGICVAKMGESQRVEMMIVTDSGERDEKNDRDDKDDEYT